MNYEKRLINDQLDKANKDIVKWEIFSLCNSKWNVDLLFVYQKLDRSLKSWTPYNADNAFLGILSEYGNEIEI